MQTSTGSTEYSLAHSRRGDIVCVGDKLDGEIARIHGAIIPFQPEMYLLRSHLIFRQSIGSQIVPLFTHTVPPLARGTCLPPAEYLFRLLSRRLSQASEKAIDSRSVLDMLQEPGLSSQYHSQMLDSSD
jgi:hypothetical protein